MAFSDDRILFERLRLERDEHAYDSLFRRWYPLLVAYACNFVGLEDAENIVQDLMTHLWENARGICIRTTLSQYLYTSVRNRCLNLINRGVVKDKVISAVKLTILESVAPEDAYTVHQIDGEYHNVLENLPEEQRKAFEMSREENLTYDTIAQEMGVSSKTVEYRVSQVLKKLRLALEDYLP